MLDMSHRVGIGKSRAYNIAESGRPCRIAETEIIDWGCAKDEFVLANEGTRLVLMTIKNSDLGSYPDHTQNTVTLLRIRIDCAGRYFLVFLANPLMTTPPTNDTIISIDTTISSHQHDI